MNVEDEIFACAVARRVEDKALYRPTPPESYVVLRRNLDVPDRAGDGAFIELSTSIFVDH